MRNAVTLPPVLQGSILHQPPQHPPGRNAAAIHLAVIAAASLPARRNDAASCRTRAVVGFHVADITVLEDQAYPRQAGLALGGDFDSGRIDFTPDQLRVVQYRVRRPVRRGSASIHPCPRVALRLALAARAERARFEETLATYIVVKHARRCERRRLHPGKPSEARLVDADRLFGGKGSPGARRLARISPL